MISRLFLTLALFLLLLPACGGAEAIDPGLAPGPDHQAMVRAMMDEVFNRHNKTEGPSANRFASPVADRVARWHFESHPERETMQKPLTLGYLDGWCVEFWVTPRYAGAPKQPESHRMAFFERGQLRGLFSEGGGRAPMDLDKWSACWVDTDWGSGILQGRALKRMKAEPR